MDILKQNGANGKIIRAQTSGKVLKQNYNFGKAFRNKAGLGNYIKFTGLSIPIEHTLLVWAQEVDDNGKVYIMGLQGDNGDNYNMYYSDNRFRMKVNEPWYTGNTVVYDSGTWNKAGINFGGYSFITNNHTVRLNNYQAYVIPGIDNITCSEISKIFIPGISTIIGADTASVSETKIRIHKIMIFNRSLTDIESDYIFNNYSGNDPLSKLGLIFSCTCNKAQILNNGSGDFVGIANDVDDQTHGEIMKLPAGTLQEQLYFANNNLFETF